MLYILMIVVAVALYDVRTDKFLREPEPIVQNKVSTETTSSGSNEKQKPIEYKIDKLCYLNAFSEQSFPWKQSECLNFEEVFKNYQYYEALFLEKDKTLTIKKYVAGKLESSVHYLVTNAGQLEIQN